MLLGHLRTCNEKDSVGIKSDMVVAGALLRPKVPMFVQLGIKDRLYSPLGHSHVQEIKHPDVRAVVATYLIEQRAKGERCCSLFYYPI
jgi:hypothetical protein